MLPNTQLVEASGAQFLVFKGYDLISMQLRTGGYEPEVLEISQRLLKDCADGIVLDIGANLGSYSVPLAKNNPHLTVHAFEPQRIVYYQLCANVVINSLENLHAHNFGISAEAVSLPMQMPDYSQELNIGAFSIDKDVRENEYECTTEGAVERIVLLPLDDGNHKDVRLIKIDVEGHELQVLKGAQETIKANDYPPIIFEAWTWKPWYKERREELFDYVRSMGYVIDTFGENNLAHHPERK